MHFLLSLVALSFSFAAMANTGCEDLVPVFGEYEANQTCIYLKDRVKARNLVLTNQVGTLGGKIRLTMEGQSVVENEFFLTTALNPSAELNLGGGETVRLFSPLILYSQQSDLQYEFFDLTRSQSGQVSLSFDAHSTDFQSRERHEFALSSSEIAALFRSDGKAKLQMERSFQAYNRMNGATEAVTILVNLAQQKPVPVTGEICEGEICRANMEIGRVNHPCLHGHPWRSVTFRLSLKKDWSSYAIEGFNLNKCQ